MSWIAIIGAFLRLTLEIFTTMRATKSERKSERKALQDEVSEAIAARDITRVNAAFNKLRNL